MMTSKNSTDTDRSLELAFDQLHRDSRFNRLFTLAALILSIAAIFVSLMEVSAMRTQQRATVWPSVTLDRSYNSEGFQLELVNKGVGPALLGDVKLFLGQTEITDIDALIVETLGEEKAFSYDIYMMSNPTGSVVAAGETVNLFSVPWEPRTREFVNARASQIDIKACYCSIHGDCSSVSLNEGQQKRVDECPGSQVP